MGVPVSSFTDFNHQISAVRDKSPIFGFLLCGGHPSQEMVNHFTQKRAPWIDDLARGPGIYFFFPFHHEGEKFHNPSVEISNIFKIRIAKLPGIVLFSPPDQHGKLACKHAFYIPLEDGELGSVNVYEPMFTELFEFIRKSALILDK